MAQNGAKNLNAVKSSDTLKLQDSGMSYIKNSNNDKNMSAKSKRAAQAKDVFEKCLNFFCFTDWGRLTPTRKNVQQKMIEFSKEANLSITKDGQIKKFVDIIKKNIKENCPIKKEEKKLSNKIIEKITESAKDQCLKEQQED